MTSISESLISAKKSAVSGKFRYHRILPNAGTGDLTLTNVAQQQKYTIPANQPINLYHSRHRRKLDVAAGVGWNNLFTHANADIDRIHCQFVAGPNLVNDDYVSEHSKVMAPMATKLDDFLENDGNETSAETGNLLYRSNKLAAANFRTPLTVDTVEGAAALAYTEQNYIVTSGEATAVTKNYSTKLHELDIDSFFSVDQTLVFPQPLELTINYKPKTQIGYHSSVLPGGATPTQTDIVSACVMSDMVLDLAVESDPVIAAGLINVARNQTQEVLFPFKIADFNSTPLATSNSRVIRLTNEGRSLLSVVTALFNTASTGVLAFDNSNVGEAKVSTWYSALNSVPLRDEPLDCSKNEDFKELQPLLKSSVVQNSNIFKYNRCAIDSFRSGKTSEWKDMAKHEDGILLTGQSLDYSLFQNTVSAVYRMYSWTTVQRRLIMAPNGMVQVVNQ